MKKIVLTVAAVMSMTLAFAAGENDNNNTTTNTNAYKFNVSTYALSRALNLDFDQVDVVEDNNRTFALNDRQYREYVKLLNVTLNNRGLNK